ncbi:Hypothetical_protein [Hexamita inflata]|uniref:Hypothetical_protein n=1 Tax=Hexamita inflata TaxID=28002 RepID=A0AA86NFT6_9EUKA|nr:Hypothetical protein HINF_LOCUS6148 [Hexamita inflata]
MTTQQYIVNITQHNTSEDATPQRIYLNKNKYTVAVTSTSQRSQLDFIVSSQTLDSENHWSSLLQMGPDSLINEKGPQGNTCHYTDTSSEIPDDVIKLSVKQ